MNKKISVDIDGVLTKETYGFGKEYYPKRTPNKFNIESLNDYKRRGFIIVLHSARYPEDLNITKKWLKKYKVPYDKLILGKPQAEFYADDRGVNQLDREVLCFSGGVDSLIAWHYLDFPQPIYIKLWHRYQNKEMKCISKLEKYISKLKVKYINGINLGKFEVGDKAYIPQRNFHLALVASHYGNKIYIVGIKGDKVEDKTPEAFKTMSYAMNFIQKPEEPKIDIDSPFWGMTKTEIIKWFVDKYKPAYAKKVLKTSVSCYDSTTDGSCGRCFACARKWIALEAAGIKSYTWFERDIRQFKGLKTYVNGIKKGLYDSQRAEETKEVFKKYGLW